MRRRAMIGLLLLLLGCAGTESANHPGNLVVSLTAAGTNDGAIVMVVSGGPVISVDAPSGYQIASNADGAGTHIMVTGSIGVGELATIAVPDVSRVSAYVVTIVEVADRTSFGLLDTAPYQATLQVAK